MKMEVNGLQSQIDYMLNVVDKCRANKMTGRLSTSLADSVASTIERHDKLRANIDDTLSKIERAQSNVDDFEVSHVEELDGGGPTPLQCFAVSHWGQWDFEFFGLKISRTQRTGMPLGSIIGGPGPMHITFLRVRKFA